MSKKTEASNLDEVKRRLESVIKKEKSSLVNAPVNVTANKAGGKTGKNK
jgi:hypothetical protein